MGFAELAAGDLVGWICDWIANVAGTADITATGGTAIIGKVTASIQGDLVRLELTDAAARTPPELLGPAIEQGYVQAYREALHQAGMVFDRLEQDTAGDPVALRRIRRIREEHADHDGLRRMLRRQRLRQESDWDPAADPLRRRI